MNYLIECLPAIGIPPKVAGTHRNDTVENVLVLTSLARHALATDFCFSDSAQNRSLRGNLERLLPR